MKDNFNLSLCIPERDLLPGLFKHEALAKLIKERLWSGCNGSGDDDDELKDENEDDDDDEYGGDDNGDKDNM